MLRILMSCLISCLLLCTSAAAQDSTITYQGQLRQSGAPFTGLADLEFRLFDAASGGLQIGSAQVRPAWPVEDGLFQVDLDFGSAAYGQQLRFLEVRVSGAPLSPRQAIRPSPVALFALAGNAGPSGPQGPQGPAGAQGPAGPEGPPGASPFTLDAASGAIEYRFNDQKLRFAPDSDAGVAPRISFGHAANQATGRGAVVSGGGSSGLPNLGSGVSSFVGGGTGNLASSFMAAVVAGDSNTASGMYSIVGGGSQNAAGGFASTVAGGGLNSASGSRGTVSGGERNLASGLGSTIAGGFENTASGDGSTVGGGGNNCAGAAFSWAGGTNAKVRPGVASGAQGLGCQGVPSNGGGGDFSTFVWADGQLGDFVSTGFNQFLVRANGGVGVNTNAPEAQLHVLGPSPTGDPFGQLRLEGSETSGAAGTGAGLSFLGHDGGIRRIWGYIQAVKENGTVGNSRSRMSFYTRSASGLPSERFRIDSNGTTFNTTGSWSTLSDGRLKSDIGDIPDALERLTRLRGVQFRYTQPEQALGAEAPRMGFLAEEVEQVFPEWVGYREDGYRFLTLTGFEAVVVEALRSLQQHSAQALDQRDAQIASLQAGLAQVEAENRELRQALAGLQQQSERWAEQAARSAELEARLTLLEASTAAAGRVAGAH